MTINIKKGFQELVDEANQAIDTLGLEEALKRHSDEEFVFVDLRDVRELRREGRIPGAFHMPRGMLEFWIDPDSPYFKPVFSEKKAFVFYCNKSWRSALATHTATQMGLERVVHLDGGFSAWIEAGGPVEAYPHSGSSK